MPKFQLESVRLVRELQCLIWTKGDIQIIDVIQGGVMRIMQQRDLHASLSKSEEKCFHEGERKTVFLS
jgi:hypothetical protein